MKFIINILGVETLGAAGGRELGSVISKFKSIKNMGFCTLVFYIMQGLYQWLIIALEYGAINYTKKQKLLKNVLYDFIWTCISLRLCLPYKVNDWPTQVRRIFD